MSPYAMAAAATLLACACVSGSPSAAQQQATQAARVYPDLIYHYVPPCRAFSTSPTGRIPAGQSRDFQIVGTTGFTEQGGVAGGCGVPPYAEMITMSLTAHRALAAGHARAGAMAGRNTLSITYQAAAATTAGVNAMLENGKLKVYTSAAAQFAGDVTGYFAPQLWAMVRPDGWLYMSSGRFKSPRQLSVGVYEVVADREIHICGAVATVAQQNYYATAVTDAPAKSYVTVRVFDPTGAPADAPFYVMVKC